MDIDKDMSSIIFFWKIMSFEALNWLLITIEKSFINNKSVFYSLFFPGVFHISTSWDSRYFKFSRSELAHSFYFFINLFLNWVQTFE